MWLAISCILSEKWKAISMVHSIANGLGLLQFFAKPLITSQCQIIGSIFAFLQNKFRTHRVDKESSILSAVNYEIMLLWIIILSSVDAAWPQGRVRSRELYKWSWLGIILANYFTLVNTHQFILQKAFQTFLHGCFFCLFNSCSKYYFIDFILIALYLLNLEVQFLDYVCSYILHPLFIPRGPFY